MTWFRSLPMPVTGHADVPEDVWRELLRMRTAFMGLDQNNVREHGIRRGDIVQPTTTGDDAHYGVTDGLASNGSAAPLAYDESTTVQTLDRGDHDRIWVRHSDASFEITSRMDSWWMIAYSAQVELLNAGTVHTGRVKALIRPVVSGGVVNSEMEIPLQPSGAGAAWMPRGAMQGIAMVFVQAGKHTVGLEIQGKWVTCDDDLEFENANLAAVGLYR